MTLQELIRQIESNLIDLIVDSGVTIEELATSEISDARDNLRQLLEGAATEVVQERAGSNIDVSRFVSDFTTRATSVIRTQLLRTRIFSATFDEVHNAVLRAIESAAGDGNLLDVIRGINANLLDEGVLQPSDIDTPETTPSTVGEARRATQTFDEVLDDFIKQATEVGEEKVVDLLEAFKNDSGIKELVGDNSLRIEYLHDFLKETDIYKSTLYGEDMKIRAGMYRAFDEEFVEVLQKYAKDKGMVLELDIAGGFDTVHNKGSILDRNTLSANYEANKSNANFTKKIYFPEETDDVAKRVQEYIDVQKNFCCKRKCFSC